MKLIQSHKEAGQTPLELAEGEDPLEKKSDSNKTDDFYEHKENFKAKVRLNKADPILCSDIIFQMINESLKCIEPVIYGFAREADSLLEIVDCKEVTHMNNRSSML